MFTTLRPACYTGFIHYYFQQSAHVVATEYITSATYTTNKETIILQSTSILPIIFTSSFISSLLSRPFSSCCLAMIRGTASLTFCYAFYSSVVPLVTCPTPQPAGIGIPRLTK